MDRLFVVLLALALLLGAANLTAEPAQPAFFSLLFPQLMPENQLEEETADWPALLRALFGGETTFGRAVAL